MLEFLSWPFSEDLCWPKSFYEAKKIIKSLGLIYEKIHVCILFWRENASAESYCSTSHWVGDTKKRSMKVFQYFPLTPMQQRFFILKHTANDMRWHYEGHNKNRTLKHPTCSEVWKYFDA